MISSDGLRVQVMQVLAEYWGARAQAARPAHTAAMCARGRGRALQYYSDVLFLYSH